MTGRRVWWYFFAFFGFIVVVNTVMVTLAIRTHSGIVTDHPYEKGLAYNRVVEAQEKQDQLGWKGAIGYKDGVIIFTLHDKNNHPVAFDNATATITRPTQSGMDFTLELKGAETSVEFPVKGAWEVRVDVQHGSVHYQQSRRIVVQ